MPQIVRAQPKGQILYSGIKTQNHTTKSKPIAIMLNQDAVIRRLEEAGATLLALPAQGYSTQMRQMRFDVLHAALEAYGWDAPRLRLPVPDAASITRMDQTFGWLALIPEESFVLRRIIGARALVHPVTGRYLYSWRRLASMLGADHKSVQRWHDGGITMIVNALGG